MATLKLAIPGQQHHRYTLIERGDQYEQLWRFRDAIELRLHLSHLGLLEPQILGLWEGKEIELVDGQAWPVRSVAELNAAGANPPGQATEVRTRPGSR